MPPYHRLHAWRAAHELNLAVSAVTDRWPASDRYILTAQMRRAAWSVVANIVEGSAKRGAREWRRYLDISLGSLAELEYGFQFARERGLLSESEFVRLEGLRARTARLTWGLYASVRGS